MMAFNRGHHTRPPFVENLRFTRVACISSVFRSSCYPHTHLQWIDSNMSHVTYTYMHMAAVCWEDIRLYAHVTRLKLSIKPNWTNICWQQMKDNRSKNRTERVIVLYLNVFCFFIFALLPVIAVNIIHLKCYVRDRYVARIRVHRAWSSKYYSKSNIILYLDFFPVGHMRTVDPTQQTFRWRQSMLKAHSILRILRQ